MKLGDIVHLVTDPASAYVVAGEPRNGKVRLVYCGSQRWMLAQIEKVENVRPTSPADASSRNVRRARRLLDAARAAAGGDGWIRIYTGKTWRNPVVEIVGHISIPWGQP